MNIKEGLEKSWMFEIYEENDKAIEEKITIVKKEYPTAFKPPSTGENTQKKYPRQWIQSNCSRRGTPWRNR
jgi:hypothetical protein